MFFLAGRGVAGRGMAWHGKAWSNLIGIFFSIKLRKNSIDFNWRSKK